MKVSFILIAALTSIPVLATNHPVSLEERMDIVERKVERLEKKELTEKCLSNEDGVIPRKVRSLVKTRQNDWVHGEFYKEVFRFEEIKVFNSNEGVEIVLVKMFAPGYKNSCSYLFFIKDELIYY